MRSLTCSECVLEGVIRVGERIFGVVDAVMEFVRRSGIGSGGVLRDVAATGVERDCS